MPVSTQYTVKSGDDLTPERLDALNAQLANFSPQEILEWAIDNLPNLYQTTAFGLTGIYTIYVAAYI
jgi:phosphoadenosine phosphosulfate reductase